MLTRHHLETAVARGIITSHQAEALSALAGTSVPDRSRAAAPAPAPAGDEFQGVREERFRIANGFNEIFVALGVALLSIGLVISLGINTIGGNPASLALALINAGVWAALYISGLWALSEYLTGIKRMLAPSIILVIAMSVFAAILSVPLIDYFTRGGVEIVRQLNAPKGASLPWQTLIVPMLVLLVSGAHHFRFNFPFSLLLMAGSIIAMIVIGVGMVSPRALLDQWRLLMFLLGIGVFLVALLYDLSDPERQTNRSDGAFWLHMIAAPLIVHPMMRGGMSSAFDVVMVFAALAVVAILIDRRAILVASLSYVIVAVTTLMVQQGIGPAQVAFISLLVVGGGIIALGTGWDTLRRGLWAVIPALGPLDRLRPRSA